MTLIKNKSSKIVDRLFNRDATCPKQKEINRLRGVLRDIAASRPDQHMDVEKNPELVNWICDACHKASVGVYPPSKKE